MVKIVALLCVFGLGLCLTLLGSLSIRLIPRLKIDTGKFGWLISAFMFSSLVASLILGVVVDSIGYKPIAVFGFVMTAVCIFLLANSRTFVTTLISCLLLGFGAMALNAAGNTMIPIVLFGGKNPAAASNLGNVSTCLGLFLSPMLISLLLRKTSYEKAVSALAVIVLVPVVFAFAAEYPPSQGGFALADAFALLKEPAVLLAGLALFCYIALESSFCNWLVPYSKEVIFRDLKDFNSEQVDSSSQQMLSIFAIAMMIGRLVASQVAVITSHGSWIIVGLALFSGLIILGMMFGKAIWTSAFAMSAGLAFSACFPTIVGITFAKYSPNQYGSIFGIIFTIGLLGAVIVPKTIGNLSSGSSIQKSLKLLLPICIVMVVLVVILGKL
jgi:fucose permease